MNIPIANATINESNIDPIEIVPVNKENLKDYLGDINFCAPEILLNVPYNGIKCDIFSLGQLLIFMSTGYYGFKTSQKEDKYYLTKSEVIK